MSWCIDLSLQGSFMQFIFSPFSKGQYLSSYVLYFLFSHIAQHACRLRCPSSLVGSCLCLILPFSLYLQKASGFRVMVAISVAHLVLFLQKIYGIHICSSIGTGYSLQIKKFHFSPTILRLLILMVGLWLWGFISHEHFIYSFLRNLTGPIAVLTCSFKCDDRIVNISFTYCFIRVAGSSCRT